MMSYRIVKAWGC